jgi:hypothetical protein
LAVILRGDYNYNGHVDAADYTVWRNSLGQIGDDLAADGNGDQMITRLDFDVWKAHFGQSVSGESGSEHGTESVPEPASAVMLFLAVSMIATSTTRRTSRASASFAWS